jgi:hypothetical protein
MTAFYDASGAVVHIQQGGLSGAQLLATLDQLFGIQA